MKIRIKIQASIVFLSAGAIAVFSKFFSPGWKEEAFDEITDILGILFLLLGFLLRIAARGYKEEQSDNSKILVRDGPYSIIRNPMYLGTFIIGIGIIVMLLKPWAFLIFMAVYSLIYVIQIRKEEKALLKRFGREYEEYRKEVPGYFPLIKRIFDPGRYMNIKPFWIKKELNSIVPVLVFIWLMEMKEDVRLYGRKEFFSETAEFIFIIIFFSALLFAFMKRNKPA